MGLRPSSSSPPQKHLYLSSASTHTHRAEAAQPKRRQRSSGVKLRGKGHYHSNQVTASPPVPERSEQGLRQVVSHAGGGDLESCSQETPEVEEEEKEGGRGEKEGGGEKEGDREREKMARSRNRSGAALPGPSLAACLKCRHLEDIVGNTVVVALHKKRNESRRLQPTVICLMF